MFSALRLSAPRCPRIPFAHVRRQLATEASIVPRSPETDAESEETQRQRFEEFLAQKEKEPSARPQLNVAISPNHGLYAFFRRVPLEDGSYEYETVESPERPGTKKGRSWNATELRRKSFKDLHTLWYNVLRERNLLTTQRQEARRMGLVTTQTDIAENDAKCRKTMARIKQILNERRLAYEQAYALDYAKFKERQAERAAEDQNLKSDKEEKVGTVVVTRGRKIRKARSRISASMSM